MTNKSYSKVNYSSESFFLKFVIIMSSVCSKIGRCFMSCFLRIVAFFTSIKNFILGNSDEKEPLDKNYLFYTNQLASRPDGDTIDNILQFWFGDHKRLEEHHGYIQWLFPLENQGLNNQAKPLTESERQKILSDQNAMNRMLKSFKLMLDFYGMVMKGDEVGGCIARANHWEDAYSNFKRNEHNKRRVTRILKCLAIFGFNRCCKMWLQFLVNEVYVTKELSSCESALNDHWVYSCPDITEEIIYLIKSVKSRN